MRIHRNVKIKHFSHFHDISYGHNTLSCCITINQNRRNILNLLARTSLKVKHKIKVQKCVVIAKKKIAMLRFVSSVFVKKKLLKLKVVSQRVITCLMFKVKVNTAPLL